MNISPLDIRKHEFSKAFRGFDPDEVYAFLEMVSTEFESLVRDNARMREKLAGMDDQIRKYRDIEHTLQDTLLSAQRAREDTLKTAKKQADVIVREAEVKAASIVEEGRGDLTRLRNSFTELKVQKDSYLTKLKALVKAQLEVFESYDFPEEEELEHSRKAARQEPPPVRREAPGHTPDAERSDDTVRPEDVDSGPDESGSQPDRQMPPPARERQSKEKGPVRLDITGEEEF